MYVMYRKEQKEGVEEEGTGRQREEVERMSHREEGGGEGQ